MPTFNRDEPNPQSGGLIGAIINALGAGSRNLQRSIGNAASTPMPRVPFQGRGAELASALGQSPIGLDPNSIVGQTLGPRTFGDVLKEDAPYLSPLVDYLSKPLFDRGGKTKGTPSSQDSSQLSSQDPALMMSQDPARAAAQEPNQSYGVPFAGYDSDPPAGGVPTAPRGGGGGSGAPAEQEFNFPTLDVQGLVEKFRGTAPQPADGTPAGEALPTFLQGLAAGAFAAGQDPNNIGLILSGAGAAGLSSILGFRESERQADAQYQKEVEEFEQEAVGLEVNLEAQKIQHEMLVEKVKIDNYNQEANRKLDYWKSSRLEFKPLGEGAFAIYDPTNGNYEVHQLPKLTDNTLTLDVLAGLSKSKVDIVNQFDQNASITPYMALFSPQITAATLIASGAVRGDAFENYKRKVLSAMTEEEAGGLAAGVAQGDEQSINTLGNEIMQAALLDFQRDPNGAQAASMIVDEYLGTTSFRQALGIQ